MELIDSSIIQAQAVFDKRACHIVKNSPHNKGLIVDGWLDSFWHTDHQPTKTTKIPDTIESSSA